MSSHLTLGIEILGLLLGISTSVDQAGRPITPAGTDSAEVHAALDQFLRSFEKLDWEPFRTSFSDRATVFVPSAATPGRFDGRAAIEARFEQEFADLRAQGKDGSLYMRLEPCQLHAR